MSPDPCRPTRPDPTRPDLTRPDCKEPNQTTNGKGAHVRVDWFRWRSLELEAVKTDRYHLWPSTHCMDTHPMQLHLLMAGGRKTEAAMRRYVAEFFGVTTKRGEWLQIPCRPLAGDYDDPGDWVDDLPEDYALEALFREFGGGVAYWPESGHLAYTTSSLDDLSRSLT